jgi:hypothetical protein
MKKRNIRIGLLLSMMILFLLYYLYPCINLKFVNISNYVNQTNIEEFKYIYFLYGNVCNLCNSGVFLYKQENASDVLFIVPEELQSIDIDNLRRTFHLKGKIFNGNERTKELIKKIIKCERIADIKINLKVVKENRRIKNYVQF